MRAHGRVTCSPGIHAGLSLAVLLSAVSPSAAQVAVDACEMPARVSLPAGGTTVVRGSEAPCTIEFREVVTLQGRVDGTLARTPVVFEPGGTYVTATYSPGEVAFWSPSGEFQRVIGNGPGEGPGEFENVTGLVVDTVAGELYIFSGWPRADVYALSSGDFLRSIAFRTGSGVVSAVLLPDQALVTTTFGRGPAETAPKLIVVRGDSTIRVGPRQQTWVAPVIHRGRDGLWSMERFWYQLDHHEMPGGAVDFSIRRDVPWFPGAAPWGDANGPPWMIEFGVDEGRGLVFTSVQLRDPRAPDRPMPTSGEGGRALTGEEARSLNRRYLDVLLEAFTLDGRLIATRHYDNGLEAPKLLTAERWLRVAEDPFSTLTILEPILVDGPG